MYKQANWHLPKLILFIFSSLILFPNASLADLERGLENYLLIIKGEKDTKSLGHEEAREVLDIHRRLQGFGSSSSDAGGGCDPVIRSQIEGEFSGWEGETIFKLTNGQIWQQSSYAYTYHYAYRPEVLIYTFSGGCQLKVDGVDDTISVKRIH